MSLFIERSNQNLLWEMIHKNTQLNQAFENENNKQEWFKQIISNKYQTLNSEVLSRERLSSINKEVLSSMWSGLQNILVEKNTRVNTQTNSQMNTTIESTYSRSLPKQDTYNSTFENRQKEYNQMFQRPVPTDIDFTEKQDDEAITNMNELIEKAKREREQEYTQYSPPSLIPPKSLSLNIQEDISENLITENLDIPKVSFSEENQDSEFKKLENLILKMNENIEEISKRIIKIENFMEINCTVSKTNILEHHLEEKKEEPFIVTQNENDDWNATVVKIESNKENKE